MKAISSERMLTGEEEVKQPTWGIFQTYFVEELVQCKRHATASTCILFPKKLTSNTPHRCSLIKNSPCWWVHYFLFEQKDSLYGKPQIINIWKNLQPGELLLPPWRWLTESTTFWLSKSHSSSFTWKIQPHTWARSCFTWRDGHTHAVMGELYLWGPTLGKATDFLQRCRFWRMTPV